jgi:chromosome segregation ATPase
MAAMPSADDKLTDIPRIVPQRDDDAPYRRSRGEATESRRAPREPKRASSGEPGSAWRYVAVLGLLVGLAASAVAGLLYQQTVQLGTALEQSNLRITDLEGRLSTTDDSVNQSSASMQVKIKELGGEVDKLWASAWRKNDARLTELEGAMKKAAGTFDAHQKRLATLDANTTKLQQQVGSATEVAGTVGTMKQQQAALQDSIGRLNSTVTTLANTQRAQEARLKESEQWVQSNIEFRKQVTQRLTRLENPPSALPE